MIRPVILSGGGGTRLWPLSRSGNPKQFHRLFGEHSLLQSTLERCRGSMFKPPLISSGEEQRYFVQEQLSELGVQPAAILLEPVARNTGPAIAAAACWARSRGEDEPLLVMPSDHLIRDIDAFHRTIETALPQALDGNLLTFGISPTGPSTGYGYIEPGAEVRPGLPVRKVLRFIEKPDAPRAAELVKAGNLWNGGIFLFRPSAFIAELNQYAPEIAESVEAAMAQASSDGLVVRPDERSFRASPNISVDYAVMERSEKVFVVPASFDWSDVGSWDAVHELTPADQHGNVLKGDVLALDVTNSLIRGDADVTVAVVGLDRIICVVSKDAVFVAPLERAQDVKKIVEELRARGNDRADRASGGESKGTPSQANAS